MSTPMGVCWFDPPETCHLHTVSCEFIASRVVQRSSLIYRVLSITGWDHDSVFLDVVVTAVFFGTTRLLLIESSFTFWHFVVNQQSLPSCGYDLAGAVFLLEGQVESG
jgi:hypothetical protein